MKHKLRRVLCLILHNKKVWSLIKHTLGNASRLFRELHTIRGLVDRSPVFRAKCAEAFPRLEVMNGLFQGMKYPSDQSVGSTFYPKILGSYEHELETALRSLLKRSYSAIVVIGCAEGYYAIGLGRHCRGAKVYAFDTNSEARHLCKEMGSLNQVEVNIGGLCDKQALLTLDLGKRALIFSDCEGYENQLFDSETARRLQQHDFLIETHDCGEIETTQRMLAAFSATHDCKLIESLDDIIKAYTYDYPQLQGFTLRERLKLVAEGRPGIMRWLIASAKERPANL